MSIGTPTLEQMVAIESSAHAQEANQISVRLRPGVRDTGSSVWRQIDDILSRSLERSGFRQPDEFGEKKYSPPSKRMDAIVVAPGIIVWAEEYEERYGGIELEEFRQQMPPGLFKAFVRHIGSIAGHPALDISEITVIPD
jgi:hypothetical protein